jgi:hypothetical protein
LRYRSGQRLDWEGLVARLRARVERAAMLHRQAAAAVAVTAAAVEGYSPASAPAEQYAEQHDLAARLRSSAADLAPGWLGGSIDAMSAASPLHSTAPAYVRIGLAQPLDDSRFPTIAPLLGAGHLAIDADARDPRVAGLLRSVLLRLVAAAPPGMLRIRVVDAAGAGETTAAFAGLSDVMPPPVTDHAGLRAVLTEVEPWLHEPGRPDQYLVLVIASLPELTDGNDLARIAYLARIGVGCRLHLIVAGWPPPPLTAETTQAPLMFTTQISVRNPHAWVGDPPGATYSGTGVGPARLNSPVYLDPDPPVDLIRRVCGELAHAGTGATGRAWTPQQGRWAEYVGAAQRLDAVRRAAAKLVTEQTALAKRARSELGMVRSQLAAQQRRISDLLGDGSLLSIRPAPAELAAAESALGRLAATASARATGQMAAHVSTRAAPVAVGSTTGPIGYPRSPGAPAFAAPGPVGPAPGNAGPASGVAGTRWPAPTAAGQAGSGPTHVPVTGLPHPSQSPTSGIPQAGRVDTGTFAIRGAQSYTGQFAVVSGPPPGARPSGNPRLPEAALTMTAEARATLGRADAELSHVDFELRRSPHLHNAAVYAAYALLFALIQVPLVASIATSESIPMMVGAPCGAALMIISFWLSWLTIGFLYQQPGDQRRSRTPVLGAVISLLAAAPGAATLVLAFLG